MREAPLSVLMVLESILPSIGGGGAESQVLTLSQELCRRHIPVSAVVPMVRHGSQVALDSVDGLPVVRLRYPKVSGLASACLLASLAWYLLRNRRRYHVIHAHIAGNMAAMCSVMGFVLRKPVLVKLTGLTEMRGGVLARAPSAVSRLRRVALRCASAYQATSTRIAGTLIERGFNPSKVRCIPNAVNTERFAAPIVSASERVTLRGDSALVGVYVGRLEQEKGLDLLLRGWASVFGEREDAKLLLVGSGSLEPELRDLVQRLGISTQVEFAGSSKNVESYLACADFGILTSLHEGLSNTLLEYMSAGLPVLGSCVSGTEDFVVNDRTGWLFPPAELDQFVRCLSEVAQTDAKQLKKLGSNARQLVTDKASISSVVDSLVAVYREHGVKARRPAREKECQSCVE